MKHNLPINIDAVDYPAAYHWLIDRGLVGFEAFTQLQPWHYVKREEQFWTAERWPTSPAKSLLVFARRQDNDELVCFSVKQDGSIENIVLIQGWTSSGYEVITQFDDFWAWMQHVLKDISEWIELS